MPQALGKNSPENRNIILPSPNFEASNPLQTSLVHAGPEAQKSHGNGIGGALTRAEFVCS
jgi:hypothetical protein